MRKFDEEMKAREEARRKAREERMKKMEEVRPRNYFILNLRMSFRLQFHSYRLLGC